MNTLRTIQLVCGLFIATFISTHDAHATLFYETWVSGNGDNLNDCSRTRPCATFDRALSQTLPGGQISALDSGDFGSVVIDKSVTIANDTAGTTTMTNNPFCIDACGPGSGYIQINAGPLDIVTLRGLMVSNVITNLVDSYGVYISNARQVNIEKCVILNQGHPGIALLPNAGGGSLASSINLKIEDTIVTSSGGGLIVTSVPSLPVNVTVSRSSFQNNVGGGIKVDGTSGGPIKVAITDSSISLNGSNGVNAVSGPSGNVRVNLMNDVIASNALAGVQANQSNGGSATVTVGQSILSSNGSAWNALGGATLQSYQNNQVTGTTGTPPSPITFQ